MRLFLGSLLSGHRIATGRGLSHCTRGPPLSPEVIRAFEAFYGPVVEDPTHTSMPRSVKSYPGSSKTPGDMLSLIDLAVEMPSAAAVWP